MNWSRYVKPRSVTWWAALVPGVVGLTMASEPLHGLTGVVASLDAATGDMTPSMLINVAIAGIGLRGAVD